MSAGGLRPRVGIVGGGQLARMTYDASVSLGVDIAVLAQPGDEATTGHVPDVTLATTLDLAVLDEFASRCDVVTFDHEKVAPEVVAGLERAGHTVRPGAGALAMASDKASQRRRLSSLGVPVPPFAVAGDVAAVAAFADRHGWPVVVKVARGGYDGRGVFMVDDPSELEVVVAPLLAQPGAHVVVEPHLAIERELAVLVARRPRGLFVTYPVVETRQDAAAICREVWAPAAVERRVARAARDLAVRISHRIDAVGILAVELFVVDGRLLVNELAARPHNTGHFTIDACATSQFENHLRAVLDRPLGPTRLGAPHAAMANVIAVGDGDLGAGDGGPGVHLYGKRSRRGRKVGHVTAVGDDATTVHLRAAAEARRLEDRTRTAAGSESRVAS